MNTAIFVIVLAGALLGCGAKRTDTAPEQPPPAFSVDPTQCPELAPDGAGKVAHQAYLEQHPDLTHHVTVRLRELSWSAPTCPGPEGGAAICAERDQSLRELQELNAKQAQCVFSAFGPSGSLEAPLAQWYEAPRVRGDGSPTPIGRAFSARALWSQIEQVARHPYVERIEPALGEAAKLGVAPPLIPAECPAPLDSPTAKLVDAAQGTTGERQPVVVDLAASLLPATRSCPTEEELCDDQIASGWERTIVGRRMLTCVLSYLDSKLEGPAPELGYKMVDGIPLGAKLPPFSDPIHATLSFGLGLTPSEITELAKHPYVARIWTSPGLSIDTPPTGCLGDPSAPAQAPQCSSVTEEISGKFTPAARADWEAAAGPNEVVVSVRGPAPVCPRPECPGRAAACPELDRYNQALEAQTRASQTCVRALIASLGGTASDEVLVLGDAFPATLTWPQIQAVAAHPDVVQIDPRFGTAPPVPASAD